MHDLRLAGGTVLLAQDGLQRVDLSVRDGVIDRIGGGRGPVLDVSSLFVLPGIVDLHGDAFERQM